MLIKGFVRDTCAYPHCKKPIAADVVYCNHHQCDCVVKNVGAEYRLHIIWGRVHSLSIHDFDENLLKRLHTPEFKLGNAHCPSCRQSNQCSGKVYNRNGALSRCENGVDYTDPMRFSLGLCNSQKCNVKVRCVRSPACKSIVFVNQLNGAMVRSPLCDRCEVEYCLCWACGRVADPRKSILFSKYAFQNHVTKRPTMCIHCTTHDLGALALQWWLFKPKFDWWLKQWMLGADFAERDAQYLLWNWALFTVDQLALFLRPVDKGSALSYAARYNPMHNSTGELMYRFVSLPGDLFRVILRMLR